MVIFKEEIAGCIFLLKGNECRKKADEINRVGEKGKESEQLTFRLNSSSPANHLQRRA